MKDIYYKLAVAALLSFIFIQCVLNAMEESPVYDETLDISAGYYHLITGDFTINRDRPLLMKIISSVPLLFLHLNMPPGGWNIRNQMAMSQEFLYAYNDADTAVFWARSSYILLSVLLGFVVFWFCRELYGKKPAIFALFLYAFCPNMLAHSDLATSDLAVTFFIFLSVYSFWNFVKNPSKKNLVISGILFGLAQLAKFTAIYLIPIYVVFGLIVIYKNQKFGIKKMSKYVIIIFLIALFMINLGYGFQGSFQTILQNNDKRPTLESFLSDKPNFVQDATYFILRDVPVPLPSSYAWGFTDVLIHGIYGHSSFLLGDYSKTGWIYYFPLVFLIKVPIPMLILIVIASLSFLFYKIEMKMKLAEYIIISFILLYFLISLFNHINIGLRHLLPIFPFLFVFVGRIINCKKIMEFRFLKKINKIKLCLGSLVIILLAIWYIVSSVLIFPNYLAYFNEFVGPENGYKYVADSNIDWGQDIKRTYLWLSENNINEIKYSVEGSMPVPYYTNKYKIISTELNCTPTTGVIALSVAMYQDVHNLDGNHSCFNWIKKYEPTTRIGYSIFVYNITGE